MSSIIGYVLIVSVIIYGIWLLFDTDGIKDALRNATICEVLFIVLTLGCGLLTGWQ